MQKADSLCDTSMCFRLDSPPKVEKFIVDEFKIHWAKRNKM